MKKHLVLISIFLASGTALADPPVNMAEVARLPPYCRGVQQIRSISKDPIPIEQHIQQYGFEYTHLHHYCWALNSENKAMVMLDKRARNSLLFYSLSDIEYVIERARPAFVFLPEIHTGKARILSQLGRDVEAFTALNKALQLKPDYWPASMRLSDYYKKHGDLENAKKVLVKALEKTPNVKIIQKRLSELSAAK
ncbi:tetratricopeptide repeat protein [Methylomagnum sp.]